MKTAKIIVALLLGLFVAQGALAQSRDEVFPDKADPIKSVRVFPNPATDFLTVHFEQPHARKIRIAMQTIIGNTLEVETEVLDDYEIRIKVADLPSGYYLLAVHDGETNSKSTHKFLKR